MQVNTRKKNRRWGQPANEHIAAISKIYEGYKLLGEIAPYRYDEARKQILDGITAATKAMQLGERLAG